MSKSYRERDFSVVDEDMLKNKLYRKVFRTIAYCTGIGIGLMVLLPILPESGHLAKEEGIKDLFLTIGAFLLIYAVGMLVAFMFLRDALKPILFLMNWVVIPSAAIWCVMEGHRIITGP
ncbi:MAG: hypothetical protein DI626_09810 [Micavibrio aeruginosavorus]|uniref:Uncharacterized protein n=1 Tax=Micavibrio aeruginosavorus TaxID=349221 RepID=A0A2W4ZJY7_9BACT|nr:MAG: hypothetical protein DI626_09810 [Micavibrio aeruginosavorus]